MGEGAHWSDFFVAQVGAAAALSGLLIVAGSINLQNILTNPHVLPGRAGEALIMLVGAMLVASVSLVPAQPVRLLGMEILAIGAVVLATAACFQVKSLIRVRKQPINWWLPRLVLTLVATVPIVAGGMMLALGHADGLYWAAAGVMLSLAGGVFNTWILLIEILR